MPANLPLPKKSELTNEERRVDEKSNRLIQTITFFGDSAIAEGDPLYTSAYDAAKLLAENGYTIVNGGGPGIMKAATDGAESVDGDTVAVYWEPKLASFFEGKNLANITDESGASANYVMRTLGLIEKGDAYVVNKGGTGTVSEFGLVWALAKLYYGCHKPVILYGDFWDDLIEAFRKTMYIDDTELGVLYQATNPDELLTILQKHEQKIQHCRIQGANDREGESAFILGARVKETMEEFNRTASSYHSERAGNLAAQEQLDEFMSMVNAPAHVLDIGTGPGFDLKYLSEKYSVEGLDLSKRMVEIARYENPNIKIDQADIVTHELEKNRYKGVWVRNTLHHIHSEDLDGVFKKIADSLVEEGVLYVIVREGKGEEMVVEKESYGETTMFYHYFTESELVDRAEKAGLKLVKIDHKKRSHKWIVGVFKK